MRRQESSFALRRENLVDALREAIVGLCFALLVAPLIFLASDRGHLTSDLSQRLHFLINARGGALGPGEKPKGLTGQRAPNSWFFLDLHGGFCEPSVGVRRCPPAVAQTDHGALAKLIENVRAQRPRLLVVDVLLAQSADPKGDEALRAALRKEGAPVLLSWFPANGQVDADTLGAENETLLFDLDPAHAPSTVRYLPAVNTMDGATARYLAPNRRVALRDRALKMPTISYGAALVLSAPERRPFALVDSFSAVSGLTCGIHEREDCDDYARTQRIFSFPRRGPHEDAPYSGNHDDPFFGRIETVAQAQPGLDGPALLKGAVVVIGNSDYAAGDQRWTALGDVSGAELILNDIRQYLVNPPAPERGFWPQFFLSMREEWAFYALGMFAIFLTELLVDWRWPLHVDALVEHGEGRFKARHLIRALVKLFIATLLSSLAYVLMLSLYYRPLVDVVSPFFGNLAQAVIEAAYQFKKGFDAAALWLFAKARSVRSSSETPRGD